MKKIKILVLQPGYHENSHHWSDLVEQIALAFDPQRYEVVTAFFHGKPSPGHPETRATRAVYFDFPEVWSRGLRLRLKRSLKQFLLSERFHVIICNRYKPVSLLMDLAPKVGVPACIGISHSFGEYDRWWRRFRFQQALTPRWRFVGVSEAVREHLIGQGCGFTSGNTVAINNAIDIDEAVKEHLERGEARKALGLPGEAVIIGAAGRLVSVKAHDILIRAFAQLPGTHPIAHLAIMGEGKKRPELEALIGELGIRDRVHLLGFIPGAKRYMRAFDVWTMPSLKEGLGLALLEGMIARLPTIASDVPAMAPIVRGGGGQLVPPGEVQPLALALHKYVTASDDERRRLGEEAHAFARKAHSIDQYRRSYVELVQSMLAVP